MVVIIFRIYSIFPWIYLENHQTTWEENAALYTVRATMMKRIKPRFFDCHLQKQNLLNDSAG